MKKKNNIRNIAENKGITLIALVITVIILIILSTITIDAAFGEKGLIESAQQVKNSTEQAIEKEKDSLNQLMDEFNNIIAGGNGGSDEGDEPEELPKGTITFDEYVWKGDGTANIIVKTSETGYTLQYQINGPEEDSWTDIESGGTINELMHGDTVYARLTDGTKESEHANVTIEDKVQPQEAELNLGGTNSWNLLLTCIN